MKGLWKRLSHSSGAEQHHAPPPITFASLICWRFIHDQSSTIMYLIIPKSQYEDEIKKKKELKAWTSFQKLKIIQWPYVTLLQGSVSEVSLQGPGRHSWLRMCVTLEVHFKSTGVKGRSNNKRQCWTGTMGRNIEERHDVSGGDFNVMNAKLSWQEQSHKGR